MYCQDEARWLSRSARLVQLPPEYTLSMVFAKRLREGVRRGEITCSVRIWMYPHVKQGARYRMDEGQIEVDSIETIGFPDITPELARESGFLGVLDLLKVAKHGRGENIYLVRFHYVPPGRR
jgi:hypothetical protein